MQLALSSESSSAAQDKTCSGLEATALSFKASGSLRTLAQEVFLDYLIHYTQHSALCGEDTVTSRRGSRGWFFQDNETLVIADVTERLCGGVWLLTSQKPINRPGWWKGKFAFFQMPANRMGLGEGGTRLSKG